MQRIRTAMAADPDQERLLHGIVEADETYIGGKPRKGNRRAEDKPNKRERGTKKISVIGVVETKRARRGARCKSRRFVGQGNWQIYPTRTPTRLQAARHNDALRCPRRAGR